MLAALLAVLPVFALVGAGFLARRTGALGPQATAELNRFVVLLALPALLFAVVARAAPAAFADWRFVAVAGGGAALVFAGTVAVRSARGATLPDAALEGLNAGYANTGYMGFPLALAAFGPRALPETTLSVVLTVCFVFAAAIVLIEFGLAAGRGGRGVARKVGATLVRNPLLVAPAAAALFPLTGLRLPAIAGHLLDLLGGAASPCALVALGLFLAEPRTGARPPSWRLAGALVAAKLLVQPAATFALALLVALPRTETAIALLLAALPTGTGPFMLAEYHGRDAALTARVVLVSTVASVATLTALLAVLR